MSRHFPFRLPRSTYNRLVKLKENIRSNELSDAFIHSVFLTLLRVTTTKNEFLLRTSVRAMMSAKRSGEPRVLFTVNLPDYLYDAMLDMKKPLRTNRLSDVAIFCIELANNIREFLKDKETSDDIKLAYQAVMEHKEVS